MTWPLPDSFAPHELLKTLKTRLWLWLGPTLGLGLFAAAWALLAPAAWEAAQALVVRDEAVGSISRQGRFDSADARKTAQETLLEIARNPAVGSAALAELPPPEGRRPAAWPSEPEVEGVRNSIRVSAPKGSELGQTEVIYVTVRQSSRQRAAALVSALCTQIEIRLQKLRNTKADSVIAELKNTVELARLDLQAATDRLQILEREVGSDLGELRILNDSGAGDSNLRSALNKVTEELRQVRSDCEAKQHLRDILTAALDDPGQLVATPNQLLESQPAVRRLKEGLVDAQLRTSQILGKMSPQHPLAQAAATSEQKIRQNLHDELQIAIRGLEADLSVRNTQRASLGTQHAEIKGRLDRLADLRARYDNLVADVRQRGKILEEAQRALSEARANQAVPQAASLITRLDSPHTGNSPVGPGRLTIVLSGFGGGLVLGLGLVFLVAPLGRGRRWTDYFPGRRRTDALAQGRRAADPVPGRRAEDPGPARRATDPPPARRAEDLARPSSIQPDSPQADRRSGKDRRGTAPPPSPLPVN